MRLMTAGTKVITKQERPLGDERPVLPPGQRSAGGVAELGPREDYDAERRGAEGGITDVLSVVCVFW